MPINVLIVDDSALMRSLLTKIISGSEDINVVGTAADPYEARDKIKRLKPDVITLDVEMPKMDGLTFLKNLMRLHPLPVIMISQLTERGSKVAMTALELGAIDVIDKPKSDVNGQIVHYSSEIIAKIRMASKASISVLSKTCNKNIKSVTNQVATSVEPPISKMLAEKLERKIIAIGSSTGGTDALKEVMSGFPSASPPIVVTQHIPQFISASFADRLNTICKVKVHEAKDGLEILPGHAYIAPGGRHFEVFKSGNQLICKIHDGPEVNSHKPSVDNLFKSVARFMGRDAIGVILTGMGRDGATGLKVMRDRGAHTIAQDEKTSVVFGMPKAAIEEGAVEDVLPLKKISAKVTHYVKS